ncbi:MAG: AAA family ATPase [Deltaproteobacteria bacterium]|nr:AAA family ATPase [Deltaproteobacteria bacterium]
MSSALRPLGSPVGEQSVIRTRRVFVGRERELALVRAAFAETLAEQVRALTLTGEPGIGKSRLAEEAANEACRGGARVLWGRCWEGEGAGSYWPWTQVIRSYLAGSEPQAWCRHLGAAAADIATLVPELRQQLPELPDSPRIDPRQARLRLFDTVAKLLHQASRSAPLVIVLDDLHWADTASLLLLQFLAQHLCQARVLLLATYRDTAAPRSPGGAQLLAQLARAAERVVLGGLSQPEVAHFVHALTGRPASLPLVTAVYNATEGNPFFVVEYLSLWLLEGSFPTATARPLPARLRLIIDRWLGQLSGACRRLLGIAAVAGREFDAELLAQVAGTAYAPELAATLEEALPARVIVPVAGSATAYSFSHAIIREAVYEALGQARRLELHREVGEALEQRYAADLDSHLPELAHHFWNAGHDRRAYTYALRAGAQAMTSLAYEEAAQHCERALAAFDLCRERPPQASAATAKSELAEPMAHDEQRCELLLALAEAQWRGGEMPAAKQTLRKAAASARRRLRLRQHHRRWAVLLARAALGTGTGLVGVDAGVVDRQAVALLEEALQALGNGERRLRARLLGRLAEHLYYDAAAASRRERLTREALAIARTLDDPATLLHALSTRLFAIGAPDSLSERLVLAREIIALAERIQEPEFAANARVWLVTDLLERGELPAADMEAAAAARMAEQLRQPALIWQAALPSALHAILAGRFEAGERLANDALALGLRAQTPDALHFFGVQMLALRREYGDLEEVTAGARHFANQLAPVPAWRAALADLYGRLGHEAEARREFEHLARNDFTDLPRDQNWFISMALLSETCARLHDTARAAVLYRQLRPYAERVVVVAPALASCGAVARYLGILATVQGRWGEAAHHFEHALAMNALIGARPCLAHTQREYAEMLLRAPSPSHNHGEVEGGRERARGLLDQAIVTYRELAMSPYLEQAETLRAETVRQLRPADTPGLLHPRAAGAAPNTFRRDGKRWILAWESKTLQLRDGHGLRYIAELLRRPHAPIHAAELAKLTMSADPGEGAGAYRQMSSEQLAREHLSLCRADSAAPAADGRAKSEYARQLHELGAELKEAEARNDLGRIAGLRQHIDGIETALTGALRHARPADERVRKQVSNAISRALSAIERLHPALAVHLRRGLHTGKFCAYRPPGIVDWEL